MKPNNDDFGVHESYGDYTLSIQAGKFYYSKPREDGFKLNEYFEVEIAIIGPDVDGKCLYRPSEIGLLKEQDLEFEDGENPVAGYVSWSFVNAIRKGLIALMEEKEHDNASETKTG